MLDHAALLGHVDELAQLDLGRERAVAEAAARRDRVAEQGQQRGQRAEDAPQHPHGPGAGQRDPVGVLPADACAARRRSPRSEITTMTTTVSTGTGQRVPNSRTRDDRGEHGGGQLAGHPQHQQQVRVPRPVGDDHAAAPWRPGGPRGGTRRPARPRPVPARSRRTRAARRAAPGRSPTTSATMSPVIAAIRCASDRRNRSATAATRGVANLAAGARQRRPDRAAAGRAPPSRRAAAPAARTSPAPPPRRRGRSPSRCRMPCVHSRCSSASSRMTRPRPPGRRPRPGRARRRRASPRRRRCVGAVVRAVEIVAIQRPSAPSIGKAITSVGPGRSIHCMCSAAIASGSSSSTDSSASGSIRIHRARTGRARRAPPRRRRRRTRC